MLWIVLDKRLAHIEVSRICRSNSPVPVSLRVLVKGRKHKRENRLHVVAHKITEVLVVPEVQSTFGDLEMGTGNRLGQLIEQRFLDFGELARIHHLEYVFHLIQVHNLLSAIGLRPEAQQAENNLDMAVSTQDILEKDR